MSQCTDINAIKAVEKKYSATAWLAITSYNIIGLALSVAILFYDNDLSLILLLLYPLIGIVAVWLSNNFVKLISDDKNMLLGTISIGFSSPIVFVNIRGWIAYTQLPTYFTLLPFMAISLIVLILLYKIGVNPLNKKNRVSAVSLFILAFVYGFGGTRQINCAFDYAGAKTYKVAIIRKAVTADELNAYYLKLMPWGPVKQEEEVEVNVQLYNQTKVGDTVKVNLKPGLLNIPWFYINK